MQQGSSFLSRPDTPFDSSIRPQILSAFVGQSSLRKRLSILIKAAQGRNELMGHCIFSGLPGLGKTTLAHIVAREMNVPLILSSGPAIEKPGDLAGLLTNMQSGSVLFIDEIHRLPKNVEEYLYSAMEDFCIDLTLDSGPSARSVRIDLVPFTLVGATTRMGLLSAPMRSRFISHLRVEPYGQKDLHSIIERTAHLLNTEITPEAALILAGCSRGTPRIANHLLRWARDFSHAHSKEEIDSDMVNQALRMVGICPEGLNEVDQRLLSLVVKEYGGGPVGLQTLAVALHEEASTIEEVHEPFLIQKGFLKRTLRGREATKSAQRYVDNRNSGQ